MNIAFRSSTLMNLCYATTMNLASFIIGDLDVSSIWRTSCRRRAALLSALCCASTVWWESLKPQLHNMEQHSWWQRKITMSVGSYLTGDVHTMDGEHAKRYALAAVPLFGVCSAWLSVQALLNELFICNCRYWCRRDVRDSAL